MQEHALGPTTAVTVNVTGTFTLPMHLKALQTLEDPVLEGEIIQEAVLLALSEKLGGFEKMSINCTHRVEKPVCEVQLDLSELCCRLVNLQHAYTHAQSYILQLRDLVSTMTEQHQERGVKRNEGGQFAVPEVLGVIGGLLEQALGDPGEAPIVATIRDEIRSLEETKDFVTSHDNASSPPDARFDPWADGYRPLLDSHDNDSEGADIQGGDLSRD